MNSRITVLDFGYIELIDAWGRLEPEAKPGDEAIIAAARMSTGKGFLGWGPKGYECPTTGCGWKSGEHPGDAGCPVCGSGLTTVLGDEKLLRYLYENSHSTPLEMAGLTVEVKAPIFVFREWHRHRTQSYNEMSARYTPLPDENYVPTVDRLMSSSKSNKQAGTAAGADELTLEKAATFQRMLVAMYKQQEGLYQEALLGGVPKELARVHLPVGRYSRMRASANLRNWLAFLTLREAPGAQWEIRQYAGALHTILREKFPRTLALHEEGRK